MTHKNIWITMTFEEALSLLEQESVVALYGFFDEAEVKKWFHIRHPALDGYTPYQVLMVVYGYTPTSMSKDLAENPIDRVDEAAVLLNRLALRNL